MHDWRRFTGQRGEECFYRINKRRRHKTRVSLCKRFIGCFKLRKPSKACLTCRRGVIHQIGQHRPQSAPLFSAALCADRNGLNPKKKRRILKKLLHSQRRLFDLRSVPEPSGKPMARPKRFGSLEFPFRCDIHHSPPKGKNVLLLSG